MPREIAYWVKFERMEPQKVYVTNFKELIERIERLAMLANSLPEWLIRDY